MTKALLFQSIQFSIIYSSVLLDPYIRPYQVIPLRHRGALGAMAIKDNFPFLKASALLESHNQIIYFHIKDTRWGSLTLCRDAVGVFCSSSRLDHVNLRLKHMNV